MFLVHRTLVMGMGFRFRRSVQVVPGIRLNFSRSGPSVSLGVRGFHYTLGSRGTRVTAGIPGTGLSWSQYTPYADKSRNLETRDDAPPLHPISNISDPVLQPEETKSVEKINSLSTSDLAPLLDRARERFPIAAVVLIVVVLIFVFAVASANQSIIALSALYAATAVPGAIYLDRYRRSIKIQYEPEGTAKMVATTLAETFGDLRNCAKTWSLRAQGQTTDWKRNAGATTLTDRKQIQLVFGRPTCIRGTATFPALKTSDQELYFLPDALLIVKKQSVAVLAYQELVLEDHKIRFIEEDSAPSDTSVVGQTWRFVNKTGGPDRRFNGNRQLPICIYGQMEFGSASGLNCIIHYSNVTAGQRFSKALEILHRPTSKIESKAIKSAQRANLWPSVLFTFLFAVCSTALAVVAAHESGGVSVKGIINQQATAPASPKTDTLPNATDGSPQFRNKPTSRPRQENKRKDDVSNLVPRVNPLGGSIQQCLLIQDLDERVECLEQFRVQDPRF